MSNSFKSQYRHYNRANQLVSTLNSKIATAGAKLVFWPKNLDFVSSISGDKLVVVCLIDLVPDFDYWKNVSKLAQENGKKIYVITDSITEFPVVPNIEFLHIKELFGIAPKLDNDHYPLIDCPPKKFFECTISRVDSVRLSWFYFLYLKNLLEKGHVCFLFNQLDAYSKLRGSELMNYIHYHFNLNNLHHFDNAYHALKNKVPYINFENGSDINSLVMDSRYSLALETYANEDDSLRYIVYEKTFRVLQTSAIPLIFAPRGTIEKFKTLGFEIPSFLDSIDQQDWVVRQQELLNILENDSINEPWALRRDRATHNRELLQSWHTKITHPNFFDNLLEQIAMS